MKRKMLSGGLVFFGVLLLSTSLAGQDRSQADAWIDIKSNLDAGVELARKKKFVEARGQFDTAAAHWQHHHLTALYLSILKDVDETNIEKKTAQNLYKAIEQGHKNEAKKGLKTVDKIIKKHKSYGPGYLIRGQLLTQMEKFDEADAAYGEAIRLMPATALALVFRAKYFSGRDQQDSAIADLTLAAAQDDDFDLSYFERGYLYCVGRKYDQAIDDFETVAPRRPDWVKSAIVLEAYFSRGAQRLQQQSYREALSDFDNAIAIDPDYLKSYLNRGVAYFNLKSYSKALADFSYCIEKDKSQSEAYFQRAQIYKKRRQYDKAALDLKSALDLNPEDLKLRYTLGESHYYAGAYDQAIEAFNEVIQRDPGYFWAYYQKGHASKMRGLRKQAVEAFQKFVSLAPQQYRRQIQSAKVEIKKLGR